MQAQLSALDDQFQTKLAAEVERYDELLRDKEALNVRWDEQNKQLLLQHEHLLEAVTADCDAKVQVRCSMRRLAAIATQSGFDRCLQRPEEELVWHGPDMLPVNSLAGATV